MRYSRSSGFTLIELMIVIAIIGILASIAVPQYNTYRKRSSFTEVVLATANIKKAAEVAVQTGRVTNLSQLNSNSNGIPPEITPGTSVGQFVESVTLSAGTLTATSTAALDNTTYTLSASLANGGILWVADTSAASACQKSGLC